MTKLVNRDTLIETLNVPGMADATAGLVAALFDKLNFFGRSTATPRSRFPFECERRSKQRLTFTRPCALRR